eukprot:jgi/Chlat1/2543/Chrsp175S02389
MDDLLSSDLSASTREALREFLQARADAEQARDGGGEGEAFTEDWSMSQFWYDDKTARTISAEAAAAAGPTGRIACVACPSIFRCLREHHPEMSAQLFEYDRRFAAFGERFTLYDYREPEAVPEDLAHTFDVIVADPPYLSEECLAKTVKTVRLLSRQQEGSSSSSSTRRLLLTGAVQRDRAREYLNARPCAFRPQHKNKLGNEFMCFADYAPITPGLGGLEADEAL